jgi:hypothetical protein
MGIMCAPGARLDVAVIFDKVFTFFSGMNSVALSPGGDLAAVCFHDRELHIYRIIEPSQAIKPRSRARDTAASLEEYRFERLPQGRYDRPPEAEVHFRHTKLAFLDDETLLVAREIEQVGGGSRKPPEEPANISLAAVSVGTGEVVREFTAAEYGPLLAAPLLIPPKYVLFPAGETAICLDATSFREAFRLGYGGGQLGHNAIAYDSGTGRLYALAGEFESSALHTYLLRPGRGTFQELEKRPLELDGFLGNSLCLRPDGQEVAVWFTTMQKVVRRRTKKNCMYSGETGLLGRLGLFSEAGDRYLDVHSSFERYGWRARDFQVSSVFGYGPDGAAVTQIGINYRVDDHYAAKPFYLDDYTIVINSPGGDLIGVDTVSGKSKELADANSPIADLSVHPEKRLLLVGTKGSGPVPITVSLLGLA